MDQKFQMGIKLMNTDGMVQDGAEILMELANLGHIDSIEQLVYIFLDQQDFDDAESYINCAKDPNTPIILHLRARLIEERDGRDAAMEDFKAAASAGNPNSILLMFESAMNDNDLEVAKKYLDELRGYDHILSIMNEPTTFEALNQKLESRVQYFNEMAKLRAEDKVFTIAVGSDETNTFLEVRVYAYYDQQYVQNFGDDLIGAVEFCGSKDRGFEVIYVGDSWDLDTTDIVYRCKVNWSEKKVTISLNYEDYWFGELSDIDSAVEELIEKECDWELVNYFLAEDDEDDDLVICSINLRANRLRNVSNINPEIEGFKSFLVSFEKNTGDGFLSINYEESIEGLWIPIDPNNVDTFLKSVIHLALILGYGQPGYETNSVLPGNFPDFATSWQSPELVVWLDSLTIDSDVDQAFLCLLEYLTEWANEEDPGWTFILNGQGLRMSSIWTEESDIWGDREFREALPAVDMQAIREIWKKGEPGGDCSFPTPRSSFSRLDNHILSDGGYSEISPENFILAGAFKCNSGRAYVGDPYDIEDYLKSSSREKDVWTTSTLGVPVLDFGNLTTTLEKHGLVFVEEDGEGKITKAVISFDGEFSETVRSEDLVVGNYLLVNSGCLMVGDPFYLDTWNTNKVDDLDPIESTDDFSIIGCSASRVSKSFAVLSSGKSVVFDSGKGDGMYYLSFFIKSPFEEKLTFGDLREEKGVPSGRLISKVVIDFITEVDMWKFAE